jgi:hypothetical protein
MPKKSLNDMLKIGNKVRIYYGKDNINNRTVHIRGLVDKYIYVIRHWSPRRRWIYDTETIYMFELLYKNGNLK